MLLDSSALIALALVEHEHHERTMRWLDGARFATCPITEGALVRIVSHYPGGSVAGAITYLNQLAASDRHEFWPDNLSYCDVRIDGVVGPQQVTDAYLAELARRRRTRVATLDRSFASLHDDVAELMPTA